MAVIGFSPRDRIKQGYFRLLYSHKPPAIYYDKLFRSYVYPRIPDEHGDLTWVCSEMVGYGLYYPFEIDGSHDHTHGFMQVLLNAYNHADTFRIKESDRHSFYSEQELEWIDRVVERGLADRNTIPEPFKIPKIPGSKRHADKVKRKLTYYNEKYAHLPLRIYFDERENVYVHMGMGLMSNSLTEFFETITGYGYSFPYRIGDYDCHQHDFEYVLFDAYRYPGQLYIPEADKSNYTKQQLEWIDRMIVKGFEDAEKRKSE